MAQAENFGANMGPGLHGANARAATRSHATTTVIGQHGGPGPSGDADPPGPILRTYLGGGGPRSSFWRWWAWPLPPAGPMEFVCEWPALGIPETRAGLDAQLILDAAGRSIRLWAGEEG